MSVNSIGKDKESRAVGKHTESNTDVMGSEDMHAHGSG
jgi:hypothetical protein